MHRVKAIFGPTRIAGSSVLKTIGFVVAMAVGFQTICAAAEQPKVELLWPAGAPGAQGDAEKDKPTLSINFPPADKATRAGIVVCPGGGYGGLAMGHEGVEIAKWLNENGIAAFILTYRHRGTGYGHPAPLQDAQRAIRIVRARASEFGVEPNRVGIMGFSAGGHLASTVGTHFDSGKSDSDEAIERVSCRPDFMILCYPVISLTTAYTHQGSKKNLLSENPDPKLVESLSNENQVTAETPPTFLFHTDQDDPVPAENSVLFYLALRRAKVPAEMHIYEHGPHGVGLAARLDGVKSWTDRCLDWIRGRNLLGTSKPGS